MILRILSTCIAISLITCCSSSSIEDYREEAQGINRSLIKEMRAIHTREELVAHLPKLKKMFNRLVDVIIAGHEADRGVEIPPLSPEDRVISDALRAELARLYTIEGARDLVEKAQQEPLYRLDAYLQKR